jgi:methylated-DNA-[protein]-cysteine S-methyltransferase
VETPIGPVSVAVTGGEVCAVRFGAASLLHPATGLLGEAVDQVRAYFDGDRLDFELPMAQPEAVGSGFERAVWSELRLIPYGETRTYGQVAVAVGDPGAARAVGTACNRNPLPLLVPCHRVVGANGKLVGFGAGLPAKRWLLEHEAQLAMQRSWR